jgi:aryl-alcohol dehydrogenase-like predicted oxidoreductase
MSSAVVPLAARPVAPGDILFGCGPIQEVLQYPGQPVAPVSQDQVDACIHAALEAGIVDFDTAPLYGDSEDRLGHALAASSLGDKAVIYTKAGKLVRRICGNRQIALRGPQPWAPWAVPVEERCLLPDFSAAGAKQSYTESCERMGVSSVHTLRIHDPDSIEGAWDQAVASDGLIAGIAQLKADGLITDVSLGAKAY